MTAHLVHGIKTRRGTDRTFGLLMKQLRSVELPYKKLEYGWTLVLTVPCRNKKAVSDLMKRIEPGDSVVGYSNGAWIAVQTAEMGASIDYLVLINPALHVKHEFPRHIKSIRVYHSPGDEATLLSRWWRKFTRILPWRWKNPHGWGAMGRYGYLGDDNRVFNAKMPKEYDHGGWRDSHVYTREIAKWLRNKYES